MKTQIVNITPEIAKEYLKLNTFNRRVDYNLVAFFKKEMTEGRWKENGSAIRISKENVLLDGQHRLIALSELENVSFNFNLATDLEPDVIGTIDTNCNLRSSNDMFYLRGYANAISLSSIVSKYFSLKENSSALNNYTLHGKKAGAKRIATQRIIDEYEDKPDFYNSVLSFSKKMYLEKRLFASSVIGGIYAYLVLDLNWDKSLVEDFFCKINDLQEDNVCGKLGIIIYKQKIASRKMSRDHKNALLVKTWNFFATGKDVQILSYNPVKEKRPAFLANTSINFNEKGGSNE